MLFFKIILKSNFELIFNIFLNMIEIGVLFVVFIVIYNKYKFIIKE